MIPRTPIPAQSINAVKIDSHSRSISRSVTHHLIDTYISAGTSVRTMWTNRAFFPW